MKALIGILTLTLTLTACGSDNGNDNGLPGNPGDTQMQNVTDKRACNGPARPGATVFGVWRQSFQNEAISIDVSFRIDNSSSTVTNVCTYPDGTQLNASVTVPSLVNGTTYQILDSGQKTSERKVGGSSYTCSVSIDRATVTVGLVGDCLSLTQGGLTDYMVP